MQIKKPRSSAYIRLVLQPNSYTVYKVDTLSQYVIIDSNRTVLHFATPKAALSMNGSYAILIDHGAVVGQGCSYDGPPTPGVESVSDWQFVGNGVCSFGYYLGPPSFTSCVGMYNSNIINSGLFYFLAIGRATSETILNRIEIPTTIRDKRS